MGKLYIGLERIIYNDIWYCVTRYPACLIRGIKAPLQDAVFYSLKQHAVQGSHASCSGIRYQAQAFCLEQASCSTGWTVRKHSGKSRNLLGRARNTWTEWGEDKQFDCGQDQTCKEQMEQDCQERPEKINQEKVGSATARKYIY